jgi:hypothetical protein
MEMFFCFDPRLSATTRKPPQSFDGTAQILWFLPCKDLRDCESPEIVSPETVQSILWIMKEIPNDKLLPFARTTVREVSKKNNVFISKMMKLDWRDRPTAAELLADEWWADED